MELTERKNEIITLHNEIMAAGRKSLSQALRVGELLAEVKATLPHGEFGAFVETLPFTDRTGRRYMSIYRNRDLFKTDTMTDLSEAYSIISASLDSSEVSIHTEKQEQQETRVSVHHQAASDTGGELRVRLHTNSQTEYSQLIEQIRKVAKEADSLSSFLQKNAGALSARKGDVLTAKQEFFDNSLKRLGLTLDRFFEE